jgi:hypothetical protein
LRSIGPSPTVRSPGTLFGDRPRRRPSTIVRLAPPQRGQRGTPPFVLLSPRTQSAPRTPLSRASRTNRRSGSGRWIRGCPRSFASVAPVDASRPDCPARGASRQNDNEGHAFDGADARRCTGRLSTPPGSATRRPRRSAPVVTSTVSHAADRADLCAHRTARQATGDLRLRYRVRCSCPASARPAGPRATQEAYRPRPRGLHVDPQNARRTSGRRAYLVGDLHRLRGSGTC